MTNDANGGDDFVTVGRFPSVVDLAVVEAVLRDRDIPFRVLDGNTVNVAPHFAPAIGGARLQVHAADVQQALWILAEQGIPIDPEHEGSPLLEWFEERTRSLPWVGKIPVGLRLIVLSVPVLAALVTTLFFALRPPLHERLTDRWCVSAITKQGKAMKIQTIQRGILAFYLSGCDEYLEFSSSGTLRFPGCSTQEINARWYVLRGDVIVQQADTLEALFNGTYAVELNGDHLRMTNGEVVIHASKWSPFR